MDYRRKYLSKKNKSSYRCVYCGCKMHKETMTVDHIVPQNSFRKYSRFMNKLTLFVLGLSVASYFLGYAEILFSNALFILGGLFLVNSTRYFYYKFLHSMLNLAPACGPCNSSKSDYIDIRIAQAFGYKLVFNKVTFGLSLSACLYLVLIFVLPNLFV